MLKTKQINQFFFFNLVQINECTSRKSAHFGSFRAIWYVFTTKIFILPTFASHSASAFYGSAHTIPVPNHDERKRFPDVRVRRRRRRRRTRTRAVGRPDVRGRRPRPARRNAEIAAAAGAVVRVAADQAPAAEAAVGRRRRRRRVRAVPTLSGRLQHTARLLLQVPGQDELR